MQPHQKRVVTEKQELDAKVKKLETWRAMKSIYEVKVGPASYFPEVWLFEAESLSAAVLKAESKISRGKMRYENWQVYKAGIVSGTLCK